MPRVDLAPPTAPAAAASAGAGPISTRDSGPPSQRRGSRPEAPSFSFAQPAEVPASSLCAACQSPNPPDYRFCVTCGASLKRPTNGAVEARKTDEGAPPIKPSPIAAVHSAAVPMPARTPTLQPEAKPRRVETPEPRRIEAPTVPDPRPIQALVQAVTGESRRIEPRPAPAAQADEGKIVGSPVLDIASAGAAPAKTVTCARCHGHCVAGSRYCKFCGASLDEPAASPVKAAPVPAPAPSSPAAVAAPAPAPAAAPAPAPAPAARGRDMATAPERKAPAPAPSPAPAPAPVATKPMRIEPVAAPEPILYEEPGRRAEISVLAGSPVPSDPLPNWPVRPRNEPRKISGRLVVIVEDGSEGRSFSLAEGQLDIGRTDGDIVLEDDHYVSPRHARLRYLDGRWILRDLDSTNHVYLRLRKPCPLKDGDLLLLGLEVLQFQTVSDGERGLGHAIQHGTLLFGSPATPRRARLCQRTVEGVIRDIYHLFRDETVIGRETGDIVFTADPFLSRRHAAIRRSASSGEFSLVDLDSSNGTYIAIQGEVGLSNGDFLRIGQHLFRVDLG
jgi:pSer/pThr/pTyr-binding forkhead associated (FHA) protein